MAKMEKANAKMHILSHKLALTLCGIWGRVKSQEGVREGNTFYAKCGGKNVRNKLFKQRLKVAGLVW